MFYASFFTLKGNFCCLFLIFAQPFLWITLRGILNLHRKPRSMLCVVRMCSHKLYYSAPTEMGPGYILYRFPFRRVRLLTTPYFYDIGNSVSHSLLFCRISFINGAQVASEIQFHKMHWLINDKTTQVTVFPFWLLHLPLASTSLSGV